MGRIQKAYNNCTNEIEEKNSSRLIYGLELSEWNQQQLKSWQCFVNKHALYLAVSVRVRKRHATFLTRLCTRQ